MRMPEALELAGSVLVAGYPSAQPPAALVAALAAGELAGITFFRRNIESVRAFGAVLRSLCASSSKRCPPLFAIDQEGGRVRRLDAPILQLPAMRELCARGELELLSEAGRGLGRQLAALGLTMNFAPVLDVDTNPANPIIGDRAFGADPETVIEAASAFASGLAAGGILSCGKHFPGHGDTELDSHFALPVVRHELERLRRIELRPFREMAHLPALMTAHVIFECLDAERPATLSSRVIQGLLRGELGYRGVIISDDLEMKAVSERWGVVPAAVQAIEAGCDLLLICSDLEACFATREALAERARRDPAFATRLEEAAGRSLALRRANPPRPASAAGLEEALSDPSIERLRRRIEE